LQRYDYGDLAVVQLPVVETALGAAGPVRYLVEFPNPAELRPGGGYPGTMALITISHGQLDSYEIFDSHAISEEYLDKRRTIVQQPWPLEQFIHTDGLLIQDANWWADSPRSAQVIMQMYAELVRPPVAGVIAVQPPAVADLLRVTGPLAIDVDGEVRTITPDNMYAEIERQRRLRRTGAREATTHKEVLELIGTLILDRLKQGDRDDLRETIELMTEAAERRDIQFFSAHPDVAAWLDRRGWNGRLIRNPEMPTLAVSFGNLVSNKASLRMQPSIDLTFAEAEGAGDGSPSIMHCSTLVRTWKIPTTPDLCAGGSKSRYPMARNWFTAALNPSRTLKRQMAAAISWSCTLSNSAPYRSPL
jgi:hypothetical protein